MKRIGFDGYALLCAAAAVPDDAIAAVVMHANAIALFFLFIDTASLFYATPRCIKLHYEAAPGHDNGLGCVARTIQPWLVREKRLKAALYKANERLYNAVNE
jgi:hypothetical protein